MSLSPRELRRLRKLRRSCLGLIKMYKEGMWEDIPDFLSLHPELWWKVREEYDKCKDMPSKECYKRLAVKIIKDVCMEVVPSSIFERGLVRLGGEEGD